jgi:molybdopterin-guanine dinucleotide biosynthesis protein A
MSSIDGFILIGGSSTRMGTDKAQLMLNGCSFTENIASALSAVTPSVTVVGRITDFFGIQSRPDLFREWGALGGIHGALTACEREWALIVACDLPFVTPDLFARLAGLAPGFEAVVPLQSDGFLQPLCAMYRVDPCLHRCEQLIKAGERRPLRLLNSVRTRRVSFDELSDLDDSARFFDNINTPEDYLRAKAKGGDRPTG